VARSSWESSSYIDTVIVPACCEHLPVVLHHPCHYTRQAWSPGFILWRNACCPNSWGIREGKNEALYCGNWIWPALCGYCWRCLIFRTTRSGWGCIERQWGRGARHRAPRACRQDDGQRPLLLTPNAVQRAAPAVANMYTSKPLTSNPRIHHDSPQPFPNPPVRRYSKPCSSAQSANRHSLARR